MEKHIKLRSVLLCNFGGRFSQEAWYIKCGNTGKTFEIIANYDLNKDLDKFDEPKYNYSCCPHCGEKLDIKEQENE